MKKSFTDIFIQRPVLASVVSLLILVLGLACLTKLEVRQYPKMENTVITVTTAYPGASAKVVKGFITTPLERSIGSADGIDYLEAQSSQGVSTITAHIKLNFDPNAALTEVTGKVNAVLDKLPKESKSPVIKKETGDTMPNIILGFTSDTMTPEEISAYLANVVTPKINAVGGISKIQIWGEKKYAMRIWLNTQKMALLGVTPADVSQALQNNNIIAPAGQLKSQYLFIPINTSTDLHSEAEFKNLVVKNDNGRLVHLRDVAKVQLGSEDYDHEVYYDGSPAVFIGVTSAPDANPLTVIDNLLKKMPEIKKSFPNGLQEQTVYNMTKYIKVSIHEVIKTIIEAAVIVTIVIFLFLGAIRSVLVPVATIPLSLVGVCTLMLAFGFSINLLTLLAMVLAIGMVVDDAIVVLENIYRHIEEGKTPFQAAIQGAREITGPVMVMTTTLVAVYAPIALVGGITGALFVEFAFTLALTIVLSGVIALTFSPMMCSKVLNEKVLHYSFVQKVDRTFEVIKSFYQRRLSGVLNYRPCVLLVGAIVIAMIGIMFTFSQKELAPTEDQSFILVMASGPDSANLPYLKRYNPQLEKLMNSFEGVHSTFQIDGFPSSTGIFAGIILKDWSQRDFTQMSLAPKVNKKLHDIAGLNAVGIQMPPLPGVGDGTPVQFVITSTSSFENVKQLADKIVAEAKKTGQFAYINSPLKFDKPQLEVSINRAKAADLGIPMSVIANNLATMFGGNLVNYFTMQGYSYEVIPQAPDNLRQRQQQLAEIHVKTANGDLVPLSALVSFKIEGQPQSLNQFQQLNSTTIQAFPMVPLGQALATLRGIANKVLPKDTTYNYAGQSRQFMQEGNALVATFFLALIVIYLVLAAQFESFVDPVIILVSVPLSIFGAMLPIFWGASTLNIYTQIGLITLIGLISKHGILMVEFANKQQEEHGLSKREAIEKAAAIRLRPILMTTFAMVFGVVPLIMATGAGAVSRFDVGMVIATGMLIGTLFTLFVVPTVYTYLAQDRQKVLAKKAKIQIMPEDTPKA